MPDFEYSTPALFIDEDIVTANHLRLQTYASEHNLEVRSHVKSHRAEHFTDLSRESFGPRLAVARTSEAQLLNLNAQDDVMLTRAPAYHGAINDVLQLGQQQNRTFCVDTPEQVDLLQHAAEILDTSIRVAVLVDVGASRDGVSSELELQEVLDKFVGNRLQLWGIVAYGGHLYGTRALDPKEFEQVAAIIQRYSQLIGEAGFADFEISYGSTPTLLRSHELQTITEIRPGNFFFNDLTLLESGHCAPHECAVTVKSSVLKRRGDTIIIDAGSKSLSGRQYDDPQGPVFGRILELPGSRFYKVNEEHGFVDISKCEKVPAVGSTVTILPVHAALTMNNFNRFVLESNSNPFEYHTIGAANAD